MGVRVKICGITNLADAEVAVSAGADALGFIFFEKSKRFVLPGIAQEIINQLPPFVSRVGVFVNSSTERVIQIVEETGINLLQFHGEEPPEFCAAFALPVIKAFSMRDAASLASLPKYKTAGFLLDTWSPAARGGTGESFNWDLAVRAREVNQHIILAGGLTPENVGRAILQVQPYGVDVASGVELSSGKKDPAKVRAFIAAAKSS